MSDLVVMCDDRRKSILRRLLVDTGERDLTVVEIGSYAGESADAFLSSGVVKRLYCVDPWVDGYDKNDIASPTASKAEHSFDERFAGDSRVVKVRGTIDDFIARFGDTVQVDCVYIDGCHTYKAVVHDVLAARYAIRPRLFIAGHDYSRYWPAVCDAVRDSIGSPDKTYPDGSWLSYSNSVGTKSRWVSPGIDADSPFYGYVDHVIVMGCTRYRMRQECVRRELSRVGITSYSTILQPDSPIPGRILSGVRHGWDVEEHVRANIWFSHYTAVRTCYDMQYKNVLLLEDDAVFVRDTDLIREALGEVKDPYSMLVFDPKIMSDSGHAAALKQGADRGLRHWGLVGPDVTVGSCPRCAGCRILSSSAIAEYVRLHECLFTGASSDVTAWPADMWHQRVICATGLPMLYAVPPLSVQGVSAEYGFSTGRAHAGYAKYGVDTSKYGPDTVQQR